MRAFAFTFSLSVPLVSLSFANEVEIQRALIHRDQQSAEFARGADRRGLEILHERQLFQAGRPLHPDPELAGQLRPYERERMAREGEAAGFELRLPPPEGLEKPLPLPGGPRHGVEPVPPHSVGG